jgi:hypothetical protein
VSIVSGFNSSILSERENRVLREDDNRKSISWPMKPFHNLERFLPQYFGYTKKFIIIFETVVDVVASKHNNSRII